MKKQILVLLIAVIGSFSIAVGQTQKNGTGSLTSSATPYCPTPTPITASCIQAPGPLNPTPGQLYTYEVSVDPVIAAPGFIHWFVTTDPAFISGGVLTTNIEIAATSPYIIAAGASYNNLTNVSPTVDITWEGMPATGNLFLVTYVKDAAGCTDNIKVYDITIQHTFTLDLAYIDPAGASTTVDEDCVAPVFGANFNAGVVEMDYGTNYIFFVVNAANFSHSWMPSFELDITGTTGSTILAVDWAYPTEAYDDPITPAVEATWNPTTSAATIYTSTLPVTPQAGGTGVDADGECIIVRVTVDHNQNQAIANIPFTFAVNGIMYDQVAADYLNTDLADIAPTAGPAPGNECPWQVDFDDVLSYVLTLRPELTDEVDPDPDNNFIPDNGE